MKYRNGEMVEAYKWLDFIRLAGFHDGESGYRFRYDDDERTPYAMQREDGAVAYLYHDQVGSLRVVADQSGSMIKEVLYDPFGGIIEDTNPGLRVPIGFAGGLHDRDLGFVRFGLRDYDTYTSRWTAPDPIGDKGGDPDWYGYCLDDPVNGVDPLGLFRFGKRGLGGLPLLGILSDNPIDDAFNTEIAHEHGFYEDGTGKNVGLFKEGVRQDTENIRDYELEEKRYDDKRMHRVVDSLEEQKYNLLGIGGKKNNCQDYADKMRDRYWLLNRGDRQR
ncbi:MAG: RHS repeat-associated core domain-containing protein [Desulfovibrio sp.]|nr:RHS repeat-associated core domain-containing protein [Desulfovibrio sp.]